MMAEDQLPQSYIDQAEADPPLSSKRGVKKRKQDLKQSTNDRHAIMLAIMEQPLGRAFFRWLLDQCGSFNLPLNYPIPGAPVDVNATMVNIGKASIGNLLIAELLLAAPTKFTEMNNEARERSQNG